MRRRLLLVLAVPLLLGPSCGGGGEELDTGEASEVALHASGVVVAHQALLAIDQMMEIDPTLDVTKTPEQNAYAIQQRAAEGGSCVDASMNGATVTATFAAGCTVRGSTISGQLTVTVQKTGGTITVSVTFVDVEVDGLPLAGSAQLLTTGDGSYQVTYDLTSDTTHVAGDVGLVGTTAQVTLTGNVTTTSGDRSGSTALDSVVYVLGDCYPSGGTIAVASERFTGTITFLATTPQDGDVEITVGRRHTTVSLPTYGSCPPT
jgi:hypothetical protein